MRTYSNQFPVTHAPKPTTGSLYSGRRCMASGLPFWQLANLKKELKMRGYKDLRITY